MKDLRFKLAGEVVDIVFSEGVSCGDVKDGISIEIERYKSKHSDFSCRGGVLSDAQAKRIIKYLQEHLHKKSCQKQESK